ncbi:MAG TPA: DUF5666 domain-containing protein [Patescibacteria group bacterium]|nr:DUF5666 domain-containing protein [Patescibacteria group bacterium]
MIYGKKFALLLGGLGLLTGAAGTLALQTHAADSAAANGGSSAQHQFSPPAASGTVTAVSGSTLTVKDGRSGTVYAVDASGAIIEKFSKPAATAGQAAKPAATTIAVADIAVGDSVMVQGTVAGTSITATKIVDGMMMRGGLKGQFGTAGTVAAVSGNTITLTGKDGATYTVDAASAAVKKIASIAVSDIQPGDTLMVQGQTSGNNITAKNITDGAFGSK